MVYKTNTTQSLCICNVPRTGVTNRRYIISPDSPFTLTACLSLYSASYYIHTPMDASAGNVGFSVLPKDILTSERKP